jgi:5-formyltetrahydrofolate cyclo-ligase
MEEKQRLRQEGLQLLREISPTEKLRVEHQLASFLFSSAVWKCANTIGLTMALPHEWDTTKIIQQAWLEKKNVCVPLTLENREMQFYYVESYNQLTDGAFQIKEPVPDLCTPAFKNDIDLLLVPGLLFDKSGYRIGYGGGYYDRYIADFPHTTIALASSQQLRQSLPVDPFDRRVEYLLTDDGFIVLAE